MAKTKKEIAAQTRQEEKAAAQRTKDLSNKSENKGAIAQDDQEKGKYSEAGRNETARENMAEHNVGNAQEAKRNAEEVIRKDGK